MTETTPETEVPVDEAAEQATLDAEYAEGNEGSTDVEADVQEETSAAREFCHNSYPP